MTALGRTAGSLIVSGCLSVAPTGGAAARPGAQPASVDGRGRTEYTTSTHDSPRILDSVLSTQYSVLSGRLEWRSVGGRACISAACGSAGASPARLTDGLSVPPDGRNPARLIA